MEDSSNEIVIDFGDICRLCAEKTQNKDSIHDLCFSDGVQNETVGDFVSKLTSIQLQNGLPSQVCESCISKIGICYDFFAMCRRTELELQDCYMKTLKQAKEAYNLDIEIKEEPLECKTEFDFDYDNLNHTQESELLNTEEPVLAKLACDKELTVDAQICENSHVTPENNLRQTKNLGKNEDLLNPFIMSNFNYGTNLISKRVWKCEDCSCSYTLKRNLKKHYKQKHLKNVQLYNFHCFEPDCHKSFRQESELIHHAKELHNTPVIKHQLEKSMVDLFFENVDVKQVKYECDFCHVSYLRKINLIKHFKQKHLNNDNGTQSNCPYCSESFTGTLRDHIDIKHEAFSITCMRCQKSIPWTEMKAHKREHRNESNRENRYLCQLCGKVFKGKTSFNDHQNLHSGKKDFICQVCGKAFHSNPSLKFHQQSHGMFVKVHKCKLCGKEFKGSDTLSRHKLTHSGEKKFHCDICEKGFYRRSELDRHIRYHKKLYRYVCSICGKGFVDGHRFREHMMVHKNVRPYKCECCEKYFIKRQKMYIHMAKKHNVHIKLTRPVFRDPKTYISLEKLLRQSDA